MQKVEISIKSHSFGISARKPVINNTAKMGTLGKLLDIFVPKISSGSFPKFDYFFLLLDPIHINISETPVHYILSYQKHKLTDRQTYPKI